MYSYCVQTVSPYSHPPAALLAAFIGVRVCTLDVLTVRSGSPSLPPPAAAHLSSSVAESGGGSRGLQLGVARGSREEDSTLGFLSCDKLKEKKRI